MQGQFYPWSRNALQALWGAESTWKQWDMRQDGTLDSGKA
jgi:hypothetical protein